MRLAGRLGLGILAVVLWTGSAKEEVQGDRTITKVIKMLQAMMVKSKADGENDVKLFAKYQCFCDSNANEKRKSIEELGKTIELLGGQIGELVASTGRLSTENGQLLFAMQDNERGRDTAQSLRDKAEESFVAEEADLKAAIGQMDSAIDTLSAIGADGTALIRLKGSMKRGSLSALSVDAKDALKAVSAFLTGAQRQKVSSFLQAPFTGEYQSQSGEIVGILKNMRDTFKSNLANARATESASVEAHAAIKEVKEQEFGTQKTLSEANNKVLGENDESLGSKRVSKTEAETSKADDESFLAKLVDMCATKKTQFEDRKMVRANEEAAVAEAVSILNSDEAFETMGSVKATSEGATSLLQVQRTVQRTNIRESLAQTLTRSAKIFKSLKLARVAVSLEAGNPFNKVVAELDQMLEIIAKEEKEDQAEKAWCDAERSENNDKLDEKVDNKEQLEGQIVALTDDIENEETGLKKQVADEQEKLRVNRKDQADEIEERGAENAAYQKNVGNLADAGETMTKALRVLKKFYDWLHKKQGPHHYEKHEGKDSGSANLKQIEGASVEQLEEACSADPGCGGFNSNGWLKSELEASDKWYDNAGGSLYAKVYDEASSVLVQVKEDPAPPSDEFAESNTEGASDVTTMLQFIIDETQKEQDQAHSDELSSQHSFEDSITDLKSQEAQCLDTIADLQEQLTAKEEAHAERTEDHKKVSDEKTEVERYLRSIKGKCDFITDNYDKRVSNRAAETSSLVNAKEELYSTPAYKLAKAEEEKEALGKCADKCFGNLEDPNCKACQENVSVVGYCASHPKHPGCDQYAAVAAED